MNRIRIHLIGASLLATGLMVGCKDDAAKPAPPPAQPTTTDTQPAKHGGGSENHANAVALGEKTAGGLTVKATQAEPIKPGGEGAFDLVVTGYPADSKPKTVRIWVGVEDGEGSAKAKAEPEEKPDEYHAHVEVPKPLPAGTKLWVEVEPATGEKVKVSFDLKK